MPRLGRDPERLPHPVVALGLLGDIQRGHRDARLQRLHHRVAAGHPLDARSALRPRGDADPPRSRAWLVRRPGRLWRLVSLGVRRAFGVGPLPSSPLRRRPPEPAVGLPPWRLADRALALAVARHQSASPSSAGPAGCPRPRRPPSVSWSRIASAAAKSLRARASCALLEQRLHQRVDRRRSPPRRRRGSRRPRLGQRVEAEDREHRRAPRPELARTAVGVACRPAALLPSRTVSCTHGERRRSGRGRRPSPAANACGSRRAGLPTSPTSSMARVTKPSIRAEARRRLLERLVRELDDRPVVRRDQVVAQLDRPHPLDHLGHEQRVAERLAHLLAGQVDQRVVHPELGEPLAGRASTGPARSRGAGTAGRARRRGCRTRRRGTCPPSPSTRCASPAGRVPTATATPPSPARRACAPFHSAKSRGSRLPRGSASVGGLHVVDPLAGQRAVRRPGLHVEVDVAGPVGGDVRVARSISCRDHLEHLGDVAGRPRLVRRREAAEHVVGLVQRALVRVRDAPTTATLLGRLDQDLVVDVGDVGDERDLVARVLEPAPQHVEDDLLADVADVRRPPARSAHSGRSRPCPASSGTKSRTSRVAVSYRRRVTGQGYRARRGRENPRNDSCCTYALSMRTRVAVLTTLLVTTGHLDGRSGTRLLGVGRACRRPRDFDAQSPDAAREPRPPGEGAPASSSSMTRWRGTAHRPRSLLPRAPGEGGIVIGPRPDTGDV